MINTSRVDYYLREFEAHTGRKPTVIIVSSIFLKEWIRELAPLLTYKNTKAEENRFKGIEILESKDLKHSLQII